MGRYAFFATWMTKIIFAFCAAIVLAQPCATAERNLVQLDEPTSAWKVTTDHLELATEIPASASIRDILNGRYEAAFLAPDQSVPTLNGNDKIVWGRLSIHHLGDRVSSFSVVAKYPHLDRIDWYVQGADGLVAHSANGQFVARTKDQIANRFPIVTMMLAPGETKDVYFRIRSDTVIILPLRVYQTSTWVSQSTIAILLFGLLIGCLLTMAALGFVSFFGSRHWSSLWFAVFCIASAGYILTASGIDKGYLWPNRTGDYLFMLFVFQG
ncbi:MAG: 7TM-DISM domain-containing protein, partial [Pseudomonadota bacterium]